MRPISFLRGLIKTMMTASLSLSLLRPWLLAIRTMTQPDSCSQKLIEIKTHTCRRMNLSFLWVILAPLWTVVIPPKVIIRRLWFMAQQQLPLLVLPLEPSLGIWSLAHVVLDVASFAARNVVRVTKLGQHKLTKKTSNLSNLSHNRLISLNCILKRPHRLHQMLTNSSQWGTHHKDNIIPSNQWWAGCSNKRLLRPQQLPIIWAAWWPNQEWCLHSRCNLAILNTNSSQWWCNSLNIRVHLELYHFLKRLRPFYSAKTLIHGTAQISLRIRKTNSATQLSTISCKILCLPKYLPLKLKRRSTGPRSMELPAEAKNGRDMSNPMAPHTVLVELSIRAWPMDTEVPWLMASWKVMVSISGQIRRIISANSKVASQKVTEDLYSAMGPSKKVDSSSEAPYLTTWSLRKRGKRIWLNGAAIKMNCLLSTKRSSRNKRERKKNLRKNVTKITTLSKIGGKLRGQMRSRRTSNTV